MGKSVKLEQTLPTPRLRQASATRAAARMSERDQTLMMAGALLVGKAKRERDEIEDLVLIKRLHETGGYKHIVAEHGTGDGEAWPEFCKLIGWRRQTLDEHLRALNEYGPNVMGLLLEAGVPQVGIRALLTAPEDLRQEMAAKGEAITADDVRQVLDMATAAQGRAERADARAAEVLKEQQKTERALARRTETLAKTAEDLKDTKAELRRAKTGQKIANPTDAAQKMERARALIAQALNVAGMVDVRAAPQEAARFAAACYDDGHRLIAMFAEVNAAISD